MQALKYLTWPSTHTESGSRPANSFTNSLTLSLGITNWLNEEMATFLTECGVENVSYEVRDGSSYPWLWIWDSPFLFYETMTNNDNYMAIPLGSKYTRFPASNTTGLIGLGDPVCFVFSGNPKSSFIFRIMKEGSSLVQNQQTGLWVAKATNQLSGEPLVMASTNCLYTTSYAIVAMYPDRLYKDLGVMGTAVYTLDNFWKHGLEGQVPLLQRSSQWLYAADTFRFPVGAGIEDGSYTTDKYQREVYIGTHRYMVLNRSNVGLVRLEDDDPPITEDELLRGDG